METSPLICRAEMTPSVGAENQKLEKVMPRTKIELFSKLVSG